MNPFEQLRTLTLFETLSVDEFQRVYQSGRLEHFSPGAILFEEGHGGDRIVVLLSGKVEVTRTSSDGRAQLLAISGPGSLLGEIGLVLGHSRTATVTTIGEVSVFAMDRNVFQENTTQSDPAFLKVGNALAQALAAKLIGLNDALIELLDNNTELQERWRTLRQKNNSTWV